MVKEKEINWFKQHPALSIFLGIVVLFILIGMFNGGNNEAKQEDNPNNYNNYQQESQKQTQEIESSPYDSDCPKILIPERFELNCSDLEREGFHECYYKENETYSWGDGYEMDKVNNLNFRIGSFDGENANWLYSHSYNIYEEKEILKDGTIRWNRYVVSFILDITNHNEQGYKTIKYRCHGAENNDWRNL